jgi:hypothetical protein
VRFGARDYDPTIGRWLTKDPLGFEAGINFYAFCGNDPVNRIDPTGLCEESTSLTAGLALILMPDFMTPDPSDAAWVKWAGYAGAFATVWLLDQVIDMLRGDPYDDAKEKLNQPKNNFPDWWHKPVPIDPVRPKPRIPPLPGNDWPSDAGGPQY